MSKKKKIIYIIAAIIALALIASMLLSRGQSRLGPTNFEMSKVTTGNL